jgi:hypothetical protein
MKYQTEQAGMELSPETRQETLIAQAMTVETIQDFQQEPIVFYLTHNQRSDMLNLTNEEVFITTDDLEIVQFAECVNGKSSILFKFKGDPDEYKKDNWANWQGVVRKNSVEPEEHDRIVVTEEALIFPTGTFRNPMKAQIGCTGSYSPTTKSVTLDGALIRMFFDSKSSFDNVKQNIDQSGILNALGFPLVSGNLVWNYLTYRKG